MRRALRWMMPLVAALVASGCAHRGEFAGYQAAASGAYAHLRLGEVREAKALLEPIADSYAWEARHLRHRADESVAQWNRDAGIWCLAPTPDGAALYAGLGGGAVHRLDLQRPDNPPWGSRAWCGNCASAPPPPPPPPAIPKAHAGDVYAIAVSPDGTRIATTGADAKARVWDITGEARMVAEYAGHRYPPAGIAFVADGAQVLSCSVARTASGFHGAVKLWDAATGEEIAEFPDGGVKPLVALAVSPDGKRVAAASWDHELREWDIESRALLNTYTVPDLGLYRAADCVAYSADGARIAAGTRDGRVCIWRVDAPQAPEADIATQHRAVSGVAFTPDSAAVITTGEDGAVTVWDVASKKARHRLLGGERAARPVVIDREGKHAFTAGRDKSLRKWDIEHGSPALRRIRLASESCGTVDWGPPLDPDLPCIRSETPLLVHGFGGPVALVLESSGAVVAEWDAHPGSTTNFAHFSPRMDRIVTGTWANEVALWRLDLYRLFQIYPDPREPDTSDAPITELFRRIPVEAGVHDARFSPDGAMVAVAMTTATLALHDAKTGERLRAIALEGPGEAIAFHPTKPLIAASEGAKSIGIFDTRTGRRWRTLEAPRGGAKTIDFDREGRRLYVGGGDGTVHCFAASGRLLWKSAVDDASIVRVAVHPSQDRIAVAGSSVHIVETRNGRTVLTLRDHAEALWGLAWSYVGDVLAVGEQDGTVTLHR